MYVGAADHCTSLSKVRDTTPGQQRLLESLRDRDPTTDNACAICCETDGIASHVGNRDPQHLLGQFSVPHSDVAP